MAAKTIKPYIKKNPPQDPDSLKRYYDTELQAIQVTLNQIIEAIKQIQVYIGSPPL
jgi:uncharacterized protein YneF (UPF0154 family)